MKLPSVLICSSIALAVATVAAQTISVDMDTGTDDLQEMVIAADTAETLTVALRIADADNLFSYQCKVAFDPDHFSFLAAQQDFGISGEKNILSKNGGSVIGIYQLQTNPPAEDSIVISGSITGTDASLSVDGEGCIGVLYFVSRVEPGDTATITVTQGFLAAYGEDLTPVDDYEDGVYTVDPSVAVLDFENVLRQNSVTVFTSTVSIYFPGFSFTATVPIDYTNHAGEFTIALFTVNGKLLTTSRQQLPTGTGSIIMPPPAGCYSYASGNYLCAITSGNYRFVRTVTFR